MHLVCSLELSCFISGDIPGQRLLQIHISNNAERVTIKEFVWNNPDVMEQQNLIQVATMEAYDLMISPKNAAQYPKMVIKM